jgi:nicotinate phosphoribosyltransferase
VIVLTVFNGERLPVEIFQLDKERMVAGWYSDVYFRNITKILEKLSREGYQFKGVDIGNINVEMQVFTRRNPCSIIGGIDEALAILKECTGYIDDQGNFINTFEQLEVEACHDGVKAFYHGDPMNVEPVIKIRGRYRDFAILETPILGSLAEATRIATNVYRLLEAARGKDILFFPARFTHYKLQALHGYAYTLGVSAYNRDYGASSNRYVSTDEQGIWWGGKGGGTISHSYISTFFGDTAEATIQFCQHMPIEVNRIALVDFDNDCIGTSLKILKTMFKRYLSLYKKGENEEAGRFKLFGVRPDTASSLRDISVEPIGDRRLDNGVNARLIFKLRKSLDNAYLDWDLSREDITLARNYCQEVKIIVSGGFNPDKIKDFESSQVPVDIYGVGSWLLTNSSKEDINNDFTADVVRIKKNGSWIDMAKVGRQACQNDKLELI